MYSPPAVISILTHPPPNKLLLWVHEQLICFHIHMSLPLGVESHHPINIDGRDFFSYLEHHMCWMQLSRAHQWNKLQSHMNTDRWWKLLTHLSPNMLVLWRAQQHPSTLHCKQSLVHASLLPVPTVPCMLPHAHVSPLRARISSLQQPQ